MYNILEEDDNIDMESFKEAFLSFDNQQSVIPLEKFTNTYPSYVLSETMNSLIYNFEDLRFVNRIKKILMKVEDDDPDTKCLLQFADWILSYKPNNQIDILHKLMTYNFSNTMKNGIRRNHENYFNSTNSKRRIINSLETKSTFAILHPKVHRLHELLNSMIKHQGTDVSVKLFNDFNEEVNDLAKVSATRIYNPNSENTIIISGDAGDEESENSLANAANKLKIKTANVIKIDPVFNMALGGGLAGETFTAVGGQTGRFKSGVIHNWALSAAVMNRPEDIVLKDKNLEPIILFYSFELTTPQLIGRHLAYFGERYSDDQLNNMSVDVLTKKLMKVNIDNGVKLKMFYIPKSDDDTKDKQVNQTKTPQDIINDIESYKIRGFEVVALFIDYVELMEVSSLKHKGYGAHGGEGSALLKQLTKEVRDIAVMYKIPVVSPYQLNDSASKVLLEADAENSKVDPLYFMNESSMSTSKAAAREMDNLIFTNRTEIRRVDTNTGEVTDNIYQSFYFVKTRDEKSTYTPSERDILTDDSYKSVTKSLKTSNIGHLIKSTSKTHFVMPIDGFKLNTGDYAKSIRNFYHSDLYDAVKLSDLKQSTSATSLKNDSSLDNYNLDDI